MKSAPDDEEARESTLQELMDAMGGMRAKRLPRQPAPPDALPPPVAPGATRGALPQPPAGPMAGQDPFAGMDPRLAEIIRKKQAGAA